MLPGSPRPRSPVPNGHGHGIGLGFPSNSRRRSGLRSRTTQLLGLRFGWVVLVIWFEIGEFFHSLSTCKFPDSQLMRPARRSRTSPPTPPPTHLVLLADPHVPHPRLSYHPESRPWVNALRQAFDELFMRKSWNVVMRLGRVDGVIVLGDMLDWGRGVMSTKEYEDYVELFNSIFQLPPGTPMHFIPGNHDVPIPLGASHRLFSTLARERYSKHFSPPNSILQVANHSLILLDAVGLVEEDYMRYAAEMQFGEWDGVEGGVIDFVKTLGESPPAGPKILLSHIPLARPEKSDCGPLREHGRISKGAGPGYQNLLGRETSQFLLQQLKPSLVLSGDDHDYCDFTHQPTGVREVTVKSFSSSSGIRRPGFQVLSLVPPSDTNPYTEQATIADRPCFLPDQGGVYYRVYLPIAILTFFFLLSSNFWAAWERWNASGHSVYGDLKARLSPGNTPSEKIPYSAGLRRATDRPSPLSLSRKSSQQLAGVTGLDSTPKGSSSFSRSAPVSPTMSPQPSPRLFRRESGLRERDDDEESSVYDLGGNGTMSRSTSQSRFPSDSYTTPAIGSSLYPIDQSSYFLPLPESTGRGSSVGLGISAGPSPGSMTPVEHGQIRRSASAVFSHPLPLSRTPTSAFGRLIPSPFDISSAAKAKDKSVLNYVVDSLPIPGTSSTPRKRGGGADGWNLTKGFIKAALKPRTGLVTRSLREMWAITWPTAVVWILINGMFFWR